jgi:hypothetical protein
MKNPTTGMKSGWLITTVLHMRYEKPEALPLPKRIAPDMVNYWVKNPEPVPTAMPKGDASDRPWLTKKLC